ncbi:SUKH-3 domain-containing protein [Streptomyces sp. NPDC054797]
MRCPDQGRCAPSAESPTGAADQEKWSGHRQLGLSPRRPALEGNGDRAADGFRMHAAAEGFLREFGGLTVAGGGPGITRAREAFSPHPLHALGEDDRFGEWGEETSRCLFPVGELSHGHAFLGLDEQGELYVLTSWLARFGRMPEAMENLALGVMPVRMPDADH